METPSSTRRVTRSQTLAASNDTLINSIQGFRKIEDSEKNVSKSKSRGQQEDRSALIDITNDSPIVGLANGGNLETPMGKQRGSIVKKTPGSGEALLRGQVKTLLQKVEEEAELFKFSFESMQLLSPKPNNTPQIQNLSDFPSATPSILLQQPLLPQTVDGKNQEDSESEKSLISRSLLLDFYDKSQLSDASEECSSELSYEEVSSCYLEKPTASTKDDDSSIWSMQINAGIQDEDDDEEEIDEDEKDYYEDEGEEEGYDEEGLMLDELCEGLNKISVNERMVPTLAGKHTRFVYNSDDELIKEEVEENSAPKSESPNILHLKGLPSPKGKHIRFSEEGKSVL
ncbi:hypothetical protein VNO77_40590 [Canavalia gladiata]|uniref:Uncharacterized protein n=1 Tax=Canavalia gladiata TaxID=3824 RepID=A0AAN9K041_CANGL